MTDVIGTALIRILPDMSKFGPALSGAARTAGGLQGMLNGAAGRADALARSMRGVTIGVGLLGGAAFLAAKDFESAMKEVQAVTGSTGEEFKALEDAARAAGRTGLFSAKEAALGLSELSRAGFTAQQAIDALPPVLNLATAANMEVAETAKVAVTQLYVFGLAARDTARVADAIAEADFRSVTSMEELSNALQYAAPVAEKAGLSFEETSASLAMMANAGFRGSMGGTALRAIFAHLLAPSKKAAGILKEYGIQVSDADGKMRPLVDIMKQFEKANITAGDAMTIFGQRGGPGFLGFLKQGDEQLSKLTKEVQLAGHEVETMSDKFELTAEQTKRLKKSFLDTFMTVDDMKYDINETSVLLGAYVDKGYNAADASKHLTDVLGVLNSKGFAKVIDASVDAQGHLVDSEGNVMSLAQRVGELQSAAQHGAKGLDDLGLSTSDLDMLTGFSIDTLVKYTQANEEAGRTSDVAKIKMDSMQGSLKRLKGALENVAITVFSSGILDVFADMADSVAGFLNHIDKVSPKLLKFGSIVLVAAAAVSPLASVVSFLLRGLASLVGLFGALFTPVGVLVGVLAAAAGYFVLMWNNSKKLRDSIVFLVKVLGWAGGQIRDAVTEHFSGAGEAMKDFSKRAGEVGDTFADMINSVTAEIPKIIDEVSGFITIMLDGFRDAIPVIMEFVKGALGGLVIAFKIAEPFIVAAAVAIGSVLIVLSKFMSFLSDHLGLVKALGVAFGVYMVAQLGLFQSAFQTAGMFALNTTMRIGEGISNLGVSLRTSFLNVIPGMRSIGDAVEGFGQRVVNSGATIATGVQTAMATMAGFSSGVFAGMADDAVGKLTAIGSAAMSIFMGFQAGGPIGAALAAAATAIGYFFGQTQKKSREAADAQKEFGSAVKSLAKEFDTSGVDKFSTHAAKTMVVTKEMLDVMDGSGKSSGLLNSALNNLGVDFETVASAAAKGKAGISELNDEIARAASEKAVLISDESLDGMEDFGRLTDSVQQSLSDLAFEYGSKFANTQADASSAFEESDGNLKSLLESFDKYGVEIGSVSEVQKDFQKILAKNIGDSPVAEYIRTLPDKTRAALVEQERLNKVQKLVADEQERNKGSAVKFSEAYDAVSASLDTATTAYKHWIDNLQGKKVPLADVKLGLLDTARQMQDLAANTEVPDYEKYLSQIQLVNEAQDKATEAFAIFASESGGSYDTFLGKVESLRSELTVGFVDSLGVSKEKAAELVAEILKVPNQAEFKLLANTSSAITGLTDVQTRVSQFIAADSTKTLLFDASDPKAKSVLIDQWLTDYANTDSTAKAYLSALDVSQKKKLIDGVLADLDAASASSTASIDLVVNASSADILKLYEALTAQGQNANYLLPLYNIARIQGNAEGSLVKNRTLTWVGEDGPELILPLTKQQRMAELLRQAGVSPEVAAVASQMASGVGGIPIASNDLASSLPGVGVPSGSTGPADGVGVGDAAAESFAGLGDALIEATIPELTKWGDAVQVAAQTMVGSVHDTTISTFDQIVVTLTAWPMRLWTAMQPGMASFIASFLALLSSFSTSVTSSMSTLGNRMVGAWSATLSSMASVSTTGGGSIVSNLTTALNNGATAVAKIVGGYAVSLKNALNPILKAIGEPQINLQQSRYGNINDPRIVPDGAYDVHVFGERGTHGEAYIPFNPSNRDRSRMIAQQAVAKLGGVAYFARGGVTGDTVGLNPEFLNRLGMWGASLGKIYNVGSGYRSFAEQARLYADYLAGVPGQAPAAPPGHSMHNFGLASDGSYWRSFNPAAFGLRYPMSYEPWHVEPNEARMWAGMMPDGGWVDMKPLPKVPSTGSRGVISQVASKLMEHANTAALDWASKAGMSTAATDVDLGSLPVNLQRILATIRTKESGGNYSAQNPLSSASGAYQFLDSTWGGYGGYAKARLAPPSVQDAKAAANVRAILNRYPGDLRAVPITWYTGNYPGPKSHYGTAADGGSIDNYLSAWLATYASLPGFYKGGIFTSPTAAMIGERGTEVLLPKNDPSRALDLAMSSGMMRVLDRERALQESRTPTETISGNRGFLGGGPGNVYHIYGVSMEQVKAAIRAHDEASSRVNG